MLREAIRAVSRESLFAELVLLLLAAHLVATLEHRLTIAHDLERLILILHFAVLRAGVSALVEGRLIVLTLGIFTFG